MVISLFNLINLNLYVFLLLFGITQIRNELMWIWKWKLIENLIQKALLTCSKYTGFYVYCYG